MPLDALRVGPLRLRLDGESLLVEDGPDTAALPPSVLGALATRYGRAPADDLPPPAAWLAAGPEMRVATLAYRSPVDVIANDFVLVDAGPGAGGLRIVPAPLLVAALRALAGRGSTAPR